jgi:RNA polymerase sigma-54 factor
MALTQRLGQRQVQTITLTPQLQQAIKLLELSNQELQTYLAGVILENPLLSMEEGEQDGFADGGDEARAEKPTAISADDLSVLRDSDYENLWTNDASSDALPEALPSWETVVSLQTGYPVHLGALKGVEQLSTAPPSLREHLLSQVHADLDNPFDRLIAYHLIENIEESGYLTCPLEAIAEQLNCEVAYIEATLKRVQKFDPVGVFARTPVECIRLQLADRQELDPKTEHVLAHIDLFVEGQYDRLMKVCHLSQQDLSDIIYKIRHCDPKPGLRFDTSVLQAVIPDVIVYWDRGQSKWSVRLNEATLPKLSVDQATYQRAVCARDAKKYVQERLSAASWLLKALEQRSKTLYSVTTAIIEYQQEFLSKGIRFLKPLTLKTVAEKVNMHESTVSRAVHSKYVATPRGTFELKYFFTAAIPSMYTEEVLSSETVRHEISRLIAEEDHLAPCSDDQLVHALAQKGINIARRTIAKYREELGIPSSYLRKKKYLHGF